MKPILNKKNTYIGLTEEQKEFLTTLKAESGETKTTFIENVFDLGRFLFYSTEDYGTTKQEIMSLRDLISRRKKLESQNAGQEELKAIDTLIEYQKSVLKKLEDGTYRKEVKK